MNPDKCPACGRSNKQRSNAQNRSMFGIPYKILAQAMSEAWGEVVTVGAVHEMMKGRFKDLLQEYRTDNRYLWLISTKTGEYEDIEKPPTTKMLSTVGMMRYYEALQKFGAEYFGVDVPAPNEIDYRQIGRVA